MDDVVEEVQDAAYDGPCVMLSESSISKQANLAALFTQALCGSVKHHLVIIEDVMADRNGRMHSLRHERMLVLKGSMQSTTVYATEYISSSSETTAKHP